MAESPAELAAGALTLVVAGGFIAYAVQTTGLGGGAERYDLTASFASAQGIGPGTDVRLAGVRIGTVRAMALDPETYRAEISLAIDAGIDLPEDSAAAVTMDGLLGGAFVEVEPGTSPFSLAPGAEIADTRGAQNFLGLLAQFVQAVRE